MKLVFIAAANSIHTVRWVNAMAKREHEVHLITMHRPDLDKIDENINIYYLKIKPPLGYYLNYLRVKKILDIIRPDILNVHYASGYGTLARLVKFKPTLLSVWGSDVFEFPYENKFKKIVLRKNLKAATHIASTSWVMKRQTEKFVKPRLNIEITPFGVDLEKFKSMVKFKDKEYITIGTVKKIEEIYGTRYILEGVGNLLEKLKKNKLYDIAKKIRVLIVGDGTQKKEMELLSDQLGIKNITSFIGAIPHSDVPKYLNKLDIYCAPSIRESFGVAIIEASACELPVIVSDVDGLPEVVEHGKTGYIIKSKESIEIAERLYELVIDKEKRILLGKNGREFVRKNYNWEENVLLMENVYKNLIDKYRKNLI